MNNNYNRSRFLMIAGVLTVAIAGLTSSYFTPRKSGGSIDEKHFVVVVPSYNNEKWYERNLTSLFNQEYGNYQVVYVNDCSKDKTGALVKEFGKKHNLKPYIIESTGWAGCQEELKSALARGEKFIIVDNKVRQGALANLYYPIHACPDNAVVLTVDGDDWMKETKAFAKVNAAYQDPNVLMTYGQYETWPEVYLGDCQPIPEWVIKDNAYRECKWVTSHLRTFYAGLFKKIKQDDLMYENAFFDVTWDQAFMFPMLEMCGHRCKFIPDILYVYNQANPINDFKVHFQRQQFFVQVIRSKEKYQLLPQDVASQVVSEQYA